MRPPSSRDHVLADTPYRKLEYVLYGIIFAVSACVGVITERLDYRLQKQELSTEIANSNQDYAHRLEAEISQLLASANGLAAAVAFNPDMDDEQFNDAAKRLGTDDTIVLSISLADDGIVRYVYPDGRSSPMRGKDLRALPNHLEGLEQARQSGQPILLGPLDLAHRGRALIMRLAFAPNLMDNGPSSRSQMISIVVDAVRFFDTPTRKTEQTEIVTAFTRLSDGAVIWGDLASLALQPILHTVVTPSATWQIASAPSAGWPILSTRAPAFAGLALLRCLVVCAVLRVIFSLIRRHNDAERQLLDAVEALDDGFAVFDSADRLKIWNGRYRDIYKTSSDLLVSGATFEDILRGGVARGQYPDAIKQEEQWINRRLAAHRAGGSVIEQKLDDGTWVRVVERRTMAGSIVGFRVDITELKAATEAARSAERLRTDFIAVLSHELRTPLTITMGYVGLLAEARSLPATRDLQNSMTAGQFAEAASKLQKALSTIEDMAKKANNSSLHLLALMNQLLDFSKIEAGKMQIETVTLEVGELLAEIESSFRDTAEAKGLRFLASGLPVRVRADPIRLRQIMTNLVSNAIKFTDAGYIHVRASKKDGMVLFEVRDSGCGVPDELANRLFSPFEQMDTSSKRRAKGTGLGLAISKNLAEMMGGKIGLETTAEPGSIFWFTVPLAES
jgi:two-component system, cell cycle sensor histidine kinase PleC